MTALEDGLIRVTQNISFKLVSVSDADFITRLRTVEGKSQYVSTISCDVEAQKQWISQYKCREARGEEYYFLIVCDGMGNVGTARMYNPREGSWEWGSWVVLRGLDVRRSLESLFAIYEYAFSVLNLYKPQRLVVVKGNLDAMRANALMGAKKVEENQESVFFEISRADFLENRHKFLKYILE